MTRICRCAACSRCCAATLSGVRPIFFTNPAQFALFRFLNFLDFPLIAIIYGHIALIFQNRFAFTSFFRNFAPVFLYIGIF